MKSASANERKKRLDSLLADLAEARAYYKNRLEQELDADLAIIRKFYEAGLTQTAFAKQAGIKQYALSRLLAKYSMPSRAKW